MQANLIERVIGRAGLGTSVHAANDRIIGIPHQEFCVDLGILDTNEIDDAVKPFAMSRDMPPLDRSRSTRIVNTDIAEPAARDFSRVKEPRYHGGADLIG